MEGQKWYLPLPGREAVILIPGEQATQEDVDLIIDVLGVFKKSLPPSRANSKSELKRKKESNTKKERETNII